MRSNRAGSAVGSAVVGSADMTSALGVPPHGPEGRWTGRSHPDGARRPRAAPVRSPAVTAYAAGPADPTSVVGARIGAYAIDLFLVLAASVAAPSGTITCADNQDFSFDTTSRDRPATGPAMCFDDGTTVRYIPADEEGGVTAKVYGIFFGIQFVDLVLLQGLTGASVGKLLT